MGRDYKHRGRRTRGSQPAPGWQWFLAGVALGLLVALGVFIYDRRPGGLDSAAQPTPRPAPAAGKDSEHEPPPHAGERFQFYDLLPKFEVVIPEQERDVVHGAREQALTRPGSYVLQAGSFRNHADADRMQATLALRGIESRIQKVTIDNDQTWHRVRIGPITDLNELEQMRARLRDAAIDVLVIRVGE